MPRSRHLRRPCRNCGDLSRRYWCASCSRAGALAVLATVLSKLIADACTAIARDWLALL